MKHIFFLALLAIISFSAAAQTDTTKVERYCMLTAIARVLSNKVTINVDFGDEMKIWKDNRVKDEISGRAQKFNTMIDALNYMGENGWKLVNAIVVGNGPFTYQYIFRKEFPKD